MNNDIKKFKLFFLQTKYNNISNKIIELQSHIDNLETLGIIDINDSNSIMTKLYDIIKNLNTNYNQNISTLIENNNSDIDLIMNETNDNEYVQNIIKSYENQLPSNNIFNKTTKILNEIIEQYGYTSIIKIIETMINGKVKHIFNTNVNNLIVEINDIVTPISYSTFNVSDENRDYYWRIPTTFKENDYLCKTRELWIKNPSSINNYIKICLVFKIDKLSCVIKTSQINRPILYNKKANLLKNISDKNYDNKFIKTLLRHDYLGNIYCRSSNDYNMYINKVYTHYTKLVDSTFITLMKEFVAETSNLKNMFDMIFLLLLGTDDNCDIAGLLIGLLKEKKGSVKTQIYILFQENLTFYLQSKIKKSGKNITQELEKIKNISHENVDYRKQLITNKNIPNNVKSLVLEKIEEMKSFNNEYYKQLTYVKTVLNFPWPSENDDLFFNTLKDDKMMAKEYLDEVDKKLKNLCYGHEESKKSLLQIIGKWISNPESQGACLGLVGPPGVGKTLLASSVGKALDIPFGQITLGGQNDGELLHGHGYTYSGSQPGMIVKKMVDMGKSRCILYFDELDKACSKHGMTNEITSILIHLTDPNMNKSFQDRFFQGIDFPLNKVIFIFSYNDSSKVDPILLDRIKEIKVSPYTLTDKLNICTNYIVPEAKNNIKIDDNINISNNMLEYIINSYTNEAGVRSVKRCIEEIFLHLNIDKIYERNLFKTKKDKISITKKNITDILSEPYDHHSVILKEPHIGIINGLYATTSGDGGIIQIQIFPNTQNSCNKYELKLTGKQGETMKESVMCSLTAAIDYLKKNKEKYNIDDLDNYMDMNMKHGFHVHTPSTSTPKDGPSAGCAFTCCFISRILNRPLKNDIGMTGEVELTGKVTKIGGLEFKLQGAKKAGIKTVYVSSENEMDVNNIKKKYKNLITDDFKVITFSNVDEIIDDILL